jgi:hypothetical protein
MGFPKKIKKYLPLTYSKTLYPRREELLEKINQDGTFLPKSILHADLDRGFLDFVRDDLQISADGKIVPSVDIIITTQNWAQFTETWNFVDSDFNVKPPFVTTVRTPEVKFGTNPALRYNIPNRRQYFYATVPKWDGDKIGADVYKIPQPIPVDITYQVKIICNRMRELNKFNQVVLEKFASRQSYMVVKGHYIPIIWNNVTDESVSDIDKRKYYVQSYEFFVLGFLIDEDEFIVSPAINRSLTVFETESRQKKIKEIGTETQPVGQNINFVFETGTTTQTIPFNQANYLELLSQNNVQSFDVFLNNLYYGSNLKSLQISKNDFVRIEVVKDDNLQSSQIIYKGYN